MTDHSNLLKIISFITSKGFQIHPDALVLIENLQVDVYQIVEEILMIKRERDGSKVILSDDINNILKISTNSSLIVNDNANNGTTIVNRLDHTEIIDTKKSNEETILELVTHDSDNFEDNYYVNNIIYDSNNSINSGEGVEGYTSLFRSRFDKSLKILSNRPDSKRIKKIASIKQFLNQSRINPKSQSKENLEESLFIAGLIMEKKIKKNSYNLAIDDQSGLLEAFAYDEDLKKQISSLILDQMVMIELENNLKKKEPRNKKNILTRCARQNSK